MPGTIDIQFLLSFRFRKKKKIRKKEEDELYAQ